MSTAPVTLDDKYELESGRVFLNGIQALTRLLIMQRQRDLRAGLNTAGFVSGYQGSPLNNMDQTLWEAEKHLKRHHIHFQPGHNEELALTSVWGSQQVNMLKGARYDGVFALWYGKWAGVGRCGDTFNHGNSAGASKNGGVLLVCGDDHAARSSTVATQSEYMLLAPMIPVLVPAGVQDYLDLGIHGWAMSRYSGSWVSLKAIDDTVESSASVYVNPDRVTIRLPNDFLMPPDGLNIRLPDQPLTMERRIHEFRLPAVQAYARANKIDQIVLDSPRARLGIMAAGKSYLDVRQALKHLGIGELEAAEIGIRVYKVGLSWPLDPRSLRDFADGLEEIVVVEEKRPLIEAQVKEQFYDLPESRRPRVIGKKDSGIEAESSGWLLPPTGELEPETIAQVIGDRIRRFHRSDRLEAALDFLRHREEELSKPSLSPQLRGYLGDSGRVPFFCSGCPHNTSTRVPEGSEAIAGVGCHFMASYIFPGTKIFSHMGAEGCVWIGQAPFTDSKHIFANVGDGTYYHSGLLSIRAALAAKVNITFKILFNDATAATGGQPLPSPMSVPGITRQLEAEGVKKIVVTTDEPEKYGSDTRFAPNVKVRHRDELDHIQRELREIEGVTVLIHDQTCAAEKRRRRKRGAFPDPAKRSFINTRVCEGCGDCNIKSNCVSVLPLETEFGRKRVIDQSNCNKDFSCIRGFCPSYVTVEGGAPKKGKALTTASDSFGALREPERPALEKPWGIVVSGIGGTGIITVSALLGMAGHLEGKGVSVLDMTGVAQKGGAVTSFVRIASKPEDLNSIRIAAGDADAVIGCDLVVTCEPAVMSRMLKGVTRAVINTNRLPTVAFIRNPDLKTPWSGMEEGVREAIGNDAVEFINATRLATTLMGDSIMANVFMMGFAYQKGLIPLSSSSIEQAIELNAVAVDRNKTAFRWGRLAAQDPAVVEKALSTEKVLRSDEEMAKSLDEVIAKRVAFLTAYQNEAYAKRYTDFLGEVRATEAKISGETALTEAVARNLFKLMAYKDEYEVGRLYTDGEFERQVADSFEGDYRIRYHFAPPIFAKVDPKIGEPRKRAFGPWIRPALQVLAWLRPLRGTAFDIFGYTAERRTERRLIAEYEETIRALLPALSPGNLKVAAAVASLPETIRGFGHVKHKNLEMAQRTREELLRAFVKTETPRAKAA
jgi:indolepyruvate ferredoxin oxidoreductase